MITLLVAAAVSLVFSLLLTPLFARTFRRMNLGQFIRADTPTTHVVKRGTPSMGGVVFIIAAVTGYFVGHLVGREPPSVPALLVILMMVGLGLIGFIDDFMKVHRQNSLGLSGPLKIVGTIIVSVIFSVLALNYHDSNGVSAASTAVSVVRDLPFLDFVAIFGAGVGVVLAIAWMALITTSVSNAVNLADGLDGLAAGASIFALGSYIIIGFWQNQQSCFAGGLDPDVASQCYEVASPLDLAVIAAAVVGAVIGFLWWNTSPAQIMMGDTGSFGLGGALAALAILSRTELLLILLGGLFVVITGQVIIQRMYFKATKGKRIWKASPLHHHFEMVGWPEVTIVVRFWLIAGLFVAGGVFLFYIEWLALLP
ncbi:phospho-N-acetylmuramoyl-pentapeptide-transferase [Salinibacterium hongtaonis]|uniref:Phospho-N-acetylmuramoyl-pentapeptide-transferase n=1 Tax=Homoserinimonas hongtaonis TaxID=2079791 RepID=A0A2U1SY60_9MICO|nr:phospho-N-acetylmuramoyl-pentapeptide-transferase [Salinibacterium hongtaonis]AWB89114.1 phospho-N-acetylmuramoyl-pentapeptide-transferase [Salinibacterium hongtaonis]PWB96564.1 phospho-N-acetylmuramoyl-pentapeptide-transferase [Salinibacterium hongtaonis]